MGIKKTSLALAISTILASSVSADITGVVYKDFDFNGQMNGGDVGVSGVTITASCEDGSTPTAITNATGQYTIPVATQGNNCRIEANPSNAGVGSGANAQGSAPLVDFVADGSVHNISTASPATYCQASPEVVMGALPGYHDNNGRKSPAGFGTIYKVPTPNIGSFNANATIDTKRITVSAFEDTGAIWGLAWKKGTKDLFAAATIKRYVPLKGDAGAIYKIDTENNNTVSLFTTVPNVTTAAANTALANRTYGQNEDTEIKPFVGRQGLGDIDINEEETKLYTVNIATRELIVIDANNGTILETLALPNPYAGQCDADKVRPWAVKVRGSDVFIGSVCEDQVENDIGAVVQKYNGGIITTIAQTNTLQYLKPRGYNPKNSANGSYNYKNWGPWAHSPMITDIEFTNAGDLVLGYTSRASYNKQSSLNGDIRKMCLNADGSFTDESTAMAPTNCATHEINYSGNSETFHEFYVGDYFNGYLGEDGHPETASGALAQAPGAPNIIVGMVDATDWWQPGAIGLYSNTTGDKIGAQAVINKNNVTAGGEREVYSGKSGGMGDVELLCDPAPIEIGNLVWEDSNGDGIQSAGEPPLAGVPVKLTCDNVAFGTTTTDNKGHFYFGGEANVNIGANKIATGQSCELSLNQSDVNNKPATQADVNGNTDDIRDNDAVASGAENVITFNTTVANNHSLDFGIMPAVGCAKGVLFQDNNNDGGIDGGDTIAPAGITVKIIDKFGSEHTAVTDGAGAFTLDGIPAGNATLSVDTTDTDIPQGAVWASFTQAITIAEGTSPNSCTVQNFPYALPSPVDQDPKDVASCANPTSLTWDGSLKSTGTVWQNMLAQNLTTATAGPAGDTVNVTMSIIDHNGEFYDTDNANSSGSGTSAAFGQPYLTMYLGDQVAPGDGTYGSNNCGANGYDLEAGEKADLVVEFDEPVILDNWRIRDVDSGDIRSGTSNWEWQDGIKVVAEDANGNPVNIETKIGTAGVGLIKDANGIVHTDSSGTYTATNGNGWDDGDGVTPNSTNGHIVLTSNFVAIKKLTITHSAGPDMACQTRSALAMAGFAVCKPLHISGTVFDDGNGDNPRDGVCESQPDGKQLYVQLVDSNGIIIDTNTLDCNDSANQSSAGVVDFDFDKNIKPNTNYTLVLTTENKSAGETASQPSLPTLWNNVGEVSPTDTATPTLEDDKTTANGKISVSVATDSIDDIDFGINKKPTATSYTDPVVFNPNGTAKVALVEACQATNPIADLEDTTPAKIRVTTLPDASAGILYYNDVELTAAMLPHEINTPDMCLFSVDPADGEVKVNFTYVSVDAANVESDPEIITAPFKSPHISGTLFLDGNQNGNVDGNPIGTSCDTTTPLYANLVGADGKVLATRPYDTTDGTYFFTYSDGVRVNTNYTVVLTQVEGVVGSLAPASELPAGCSFDGEKVGPTGTDGTADGIVAVSVLEENVVEANFSISQMVKIGNRVWIEDDNDGDATSGTITPVAGTTVTAVCNGTSYTAVTDNAGNYEIAVPVNSTCTVSVATPENTIPTAGSNDTSAGEDNKSHDGTGTTVTVTTSDDMTVDFGFQQMVKIGNRIWIEDDNDGDASTGNITVPPAGTVVTATASNGTKYTGVTDLNGMYSIDVPANDTYIVSVSTGKVATAGSDDAEIPDTSAENDKSHNGAGTRVVVGTEDNMTLDFGFTPEDLPTAERPGFVKIGDRIWIEDDNDGDASTGNITKPEAGLVVTATSKTDSTKVFTSTTDANGNYLIEVPANDTYIVTTQAPKGTCAALHCAKEGDLNIPDLVSENNKTHDGVRGTEVTVGTEDNLTVDFGFCPVTVVTGTNGGGSFSYLLLSMLGLFGLRRRLAVKTNSVKK